MYSVKELQEKINNEILANLDKLAGRKPIKLYAPVKYSLEMGGKRLRPVLLLMSYNIFSDDIFNALPAAIAIEVFHNFTLLHDDIMDNAMVRRNGPAVHVKFGENSAVLSGDVMAFLSYQYLTECRSKQLPGVIKLFTKTAVEVCEGQQYDMDFENRLDVSAEEYLNMIRLKTAVLLACGLKAGALLADADIELTNQLYDFGLNLGLAFQLQDDLLDTFGEQESFGKKIGGDILANKKTYLLIKALETSSEKEQDELKYWINQSGTNNKQKIDAVTGIYNRLEIKNITQDKIESFFKKSEKILQDLPVDDAKKVHLQKLSLQMLRRNH